MEAPDWRLIHNRRESLHFWHSSRPSHRIDTMTNYMQAVAVSVIGVSMINEVINE